MPKAIRIHETGGVDKLIWEDVDVGEPGAGEVRLKHTAIGLNYIDIYHRTGLYPVPLPTALGLEGVGVVEAVGPGVTDFNVGDRVAYGNGPIGAYSEARVMSAATLVKLPDGIDDVTGAAMMLQGFTAFYLLRRTYPVKAGDTILLHAAAGGLGLTMVQWAKALGATVIGTVGSPEKAQLAKSVGCDHTILYREENIAERVKDITGGKGVPVVYDSIGKDTLEASLDSLARLGMMVSFGNASGPVDSIKVKDLAGRGGLFFTRPSVAHYTATREELDWAAKELFAIVTGGKVKIHANQTFALSDAAKAHEALEGRKTTGSTVLLP